MKRLDLDINEYHELLLQMLKDIVKICDANNLRYYLVGGSALGALRDHGFIKWDDDVDIGLPRSDYEKLINLVPECLPSYYEMRYRKNACIYHFIRNDILVDKSKINIAGFGSIGYPFIDIFPIDGAPNNRILRYIRMSKIIFYTYLHKFACIDMTVEHPERSRFQTRIIQIAKKMHTNKLLSSDCTAKFWINEAKKNNYGSTDWVLIGFGSYKYKDVFPYSWIGDGVKVPFEKEAFYIFEDCNSYLRQLYGNYEIPVKRGF